METVPQPRKRCTRCGVEKPLDEFRAHGGAADGRQRRCMECGLRPKGVRRPYGSIARTLPERFWPRVNKDGPMHPTLGTKCWLWTGGLRGEYGAFWNGERDIDAHRFSYELVHGPIPPAPRTCVPHVCHRCDNPPCVNPDHLFIGTAADNMRDKTAKGRAPSGSDNAAAKLAECDVVEILRLTTTGMRWEDIARRFNVTSGAVQAIVTGKTWHHVQRPAIDLSRCPHVTRAVTCIAPDGRVRRGDKWTHSVIVDGAGNALRVRCKFIAFESIVEVDPFVDGDAPPTCAVCRHRDPRFSGVVDSRP